MAQDDDGYRGDAQGATPLGTPRTCTDCPCLVVFLAGCAGLCAILGYAAQRGDPRRLAALPDSDGRLCGLDGHGRLLFVCGADQEGHWDLSRRVCVEECPGPDTTTSVAVSGVCTGPSGLYASQAVAGMVCIPSASGLQEALVGTNPFIAHAVDISQVQRAWPLLLVAAVSALVLAVFQLCLLETLATCLVVWGLMAITLVIVVLGGCILWSARDGKVSGSPDVDLALGVGCCCIALVLACTACCQFEQIASAGDSIKEASQCILETPALALEPVLATLLRLAAFVPLLLGLLWLLSVGRQEQPPVAQGTADVDNGALAAETFLHFSDAERVMLVVYIGMGIWILELVHALSLFVVSYMAELWHFKVHKEGSTAPCCGLCRAYCVGIEHHLGTFACGALLIAALRLPRMGLGVIARAVSQPENPVAECMSHFCACVVECWTRFLEFVTKSAYMDVALNGTAFCRAAKHARDVLAHEAVAEAVLAAATPILQLAGLGGISALGALITWFLAQWVPQFADPTSDRFVKDPVALAAVAAALSFLVAWPFLHVFDTVAETILYCTAVEEMRRPEEEEEEDPRGFGCLMRACCGSGGSETQRLLSS